MRVGLVCPYPWDVPGGVMAHVRDLAEALIELGHVVSVLAPVDDASVPLPAYLVPAGRTVPVRYNGSVARLIFGPRSARRARRWLRDGAFDVLHVHAPEALSLSLLALLSAGGGPIVGTFHASNARSRVLAAVAPVVQPQLEKIAGRIAVSPAARRTIVDHLGGDAVVIPNGVHVAAFTGAEPLPGWPGPGGAIGFLGRTDEPRKGLPVLLDAFTRIAAARPGLRLLVAGPGEAEGVLDLAPAVRERVVLLGRISEEDKPRFYRSVDLYVAPNVGGESFGIVLLEAMAAGTPVVASDLDAFRRVLADGRSAELFPVGDAGALAASLERLLDDPGARRDLSAAGSERVLAYDSVAVARSVVRVYETVCYATDYLDSPARAADG